MAVDVTGIISTTLAVIGTIVVVGVIAIVKGRRSLAVIINGTCAVLATVVAVASSWREVLLDYVGQYYWAYEEVPEDLTRIESWLVFGLNTTDLMLFGFGLIIGLNMVAMLIRAKRPQQAPAGVQQTMADQSTARAAAEEAAERGAFPPPPPDDSSWSRGHGLDGHRP